jgi:hypothetical protein
MRFPAISGTGLNLASITVSSTTAEYGISVFIELYDEFFAPQYKFRVFSVASIVQPYVWAVPNPIPFQAGLGVSLWGVPFTSIEAPQAADIGIFTNMGATLSVADSAVATIKYETLTQPFDVINPDPITGGIAAAPNLGLPLSVADTKLTK